MNFKGLAGVSCVTGCVCVYIGKSVTLEQHSVRVVEEYCPAVLYELECPVRIMFVIKFGHFGEIQHYGLVNHLAELLREEVETYPFETIFAGIRCGEFPYISTRVYGVVGVEFSRNFEACTYFCKIPFSAVVAF